jgi:twitching motility two-component system response regulator PilH
MNKHILVVDDEQDVRDFICDLLVDRGYSVRSAVDGVEAMEMIKQEKPDLILLDLLMPRETGTNLYRKIHRKKEFEAIPVIVISGQPGRDLAVGKSVPVFDKPIDEEGLLKEIEKTLG